MAKISYKGLSPEVKAQKKSERATNSVIRSMLVIARRGRPLSEAQKAQILSAVKAATAELEKALTTPAGEKPKRFTLGGEAATTEPKAGDVILRKATAK